MEEILVRINEPGTDLFTLGCSCGGGIMDIIYLVQRYIALPYTTAEPYDESYEVHQWVCKECGTLFGELEIEEAVNEEA